MFVLGGMVLGGVGGALMALKRGGKALDAMHYAAAYGIAFGLLGMFLTIFLNRMA